MKKNIFLGFAITALLTLVHLSIINDYGLTWDFHHHFFAGLRLLNHQLTPDLTAHLPFTEPDPRNTYVLPFGPLMSIAPVATYLIFYEKLKIMAFDNAYNLAIVASGVLGIAFLYFFLLEAEGLSVAVAGVLFLSLYPRYFGDLHNNMKDIPQAAAFTLAIWMFWRLTTFKRLRDLLLAAAAFAVAFNTKVNTLAVPAIAAVWMLFSHSRFYSSSDPASQAGESRSIIGNSRLRDAKRHYARTIKWIQWNFFNQQRLIILLYFLLAPLLAFLLWAFFWKDPVGQLLYIPRFFWDNTINIEVLLNGLWYCSGVNVPWYYSLYYLGITTPIPVLIFFLVGLISLIRQIRKNSFSSLLIFWFFLPIARYIFPKMGVIDGIRHFEEVVFPLTAIAAVGAVNFFGLISQIKLIRQIRPILIALLLISLITPIIRYHPYQITYFNELVGGSRGALGKFDLDYWGSSQKQAILWLNENAPVNAKIYVVMAADAAGKYLRPDLLANLNTTGYDQADYVVVLNRQSFFYRYFYLWEYFLRRKPSYTVANQGVPLTWVFDNHLSRIPKSPQWWQAADSCIRRYW